MIAIIPARGGSKGVPGKNIRNLCGKPLITYTISAALKSKSIEKVIVTTDSLEIATIAKEYGADVPFVRPADLASDTASAVDVYLHAINFLQEELHESIEKLMVLLPTAPFRNEKHIDEAFELFQNAKADTLISMKEADTPISWYYEKDASSRVRNIGFDSDKAVVNRQLNQKYYVPNGAIYILDRQLLLEKRTYYTNNTVAYVMGSEESIDIDHEIDFMLAELLMEGKNSRE